MTTPISAIKGFVIRAALYLERSVRPRGVAASLPLLFSSPPGCGPHTRSGGYAADSIGRYALTQSALATVGYFSTPSRRPSIVPNGIVRMVMYVSPDSFVQVSLRKSPQSVTSFER